MIPNFFDGYYDPQVEHYKLLEGKKMMDRMCAQYYNKNVINWHLGYVPKPIVYMPVPYSRINRKYQTFSKIMQTCVDNIAESSKHIENYVDL